MSKFFLAASAAILLAACGKPKTAEAPAAAEPAPVVADAPAAAEAPTPAPFDTSATVAGVYKNDPTHAYITFSYDHQGYSKPWLRFVGWNSDLNWNPTAPDQSSITVVVDAASIDSGVDALDEHLQSPDFLDVATYPQITFNSTSVALTGGDSGTLTGDLTIKGVTKPVTFDVVINRAANDERAKGYKLGFSAKGTIKRSDFGAGNYVPFVGDDLNIVVEAEYVMPIETTPAQ